MLAAASLAALVATAGAPAHGDPTIHYLETQNLLSSYESPPAQAVELQLLGLLQAAERRGYPIKVSLIAGSSDAGGRSEPLSNPQGYATFVSSQLQLAGRLRAPVLIVVPRGFGIAGSHLRGGRLRPVGRADARTLLEGIDRPLEASGDGLARAAMVAVRQLAGAGGRPLPTEVPAATPLGPGVVGARGGGGSVDVWFLAAVLGSLPLLGWMLYSVSRRRSSSAPVES